ncbi:MAG: acyl-CoA thioesterase [Chloroflexota bacterium]|nr:acyl-CoA thioesterase [Chloroflexota bacterium]MDE3192593.1 acyl-CoA thioesterase [Chloroflexota bacterium]
MPEKSVVSHRGVFYPRDLDVMGHVNVVAYLAHFDAATWSFFADVGMTPEWIRTAGFALSAVRYDMQFKKELLAGDVVTIRSHFTRMGRSSLAYAHEMSNGATGEVVATAEVTGVLIDRAARRSVPFPREVADRIRSLVEEPT